MTTYIAAHFICPACGKAHDDTATFTFKSDFTEGIVALCLSCTDKLKAILR